MDHLSWNGIIVSLHRPGLIKFLTIFQVPLRNFSKTYWAWYHEDLSNLMLLILNQQTKQNFYKPKVASFTWIWEKGLHPGSLRIEDWKIGSWISNSDHWAILGPSWLQDLLLPTPVHEMTKWHFTSKSFFFAKGLNHNTFRIFDTQLQFHMKVLCQDNRLIQIIDLRLNFIVCLPTALD